MDGLILNDPLEKNLFSNLNRNLSTLENDFFYHLYLGKNQNDLKNMFSDVKVWLIINFLPEFILKSLRFCNLTKFVCLGGTSKRMLKFAKYMKDVLGYTIPTGYALNDITSVSNRYSMFKIGPILFANHGIGCPSLSILLNEIMKLLHYAGCMDLTFFRVGTCGGIGIEPGTVVITEEAVDGLLRPEYRQVLSLNDKESLSFLNWCLTLISLSTFSEKKLLEKQNAIMF